MATTNGETIRKARKLRRTMTPPEIALWQILRQKPLGFKFRRQHPVGPYVLDFYCVAAKLAIEVDGIVHDMGDRPQRDEIRDAFLKERGLKTVRVAASDVINGPEIVADALLRYVEALR